MPLLDEDGRLFGRFNAFDMLVVAALAALLPLGYAAWVLFRTPLPVITHISPAVVRPHQAGQHVQIDGEHLRPYLRADVGNVPAEYLFATPDRAFVELPPLEPGKYDLVFIESRVIARVPNAITVADPTYVEIVVRFATRPEIVKAIEQARQQPIPKTMRPETPKPELISYDVTDELVGTTKSDLEEGRLIVIRARVRVPAVKTGEEWVYERQPLKAGANFTLAAQTYVLTGVVLKVGQDRAAR